MAKKKENTEVLEEVVKPKKTKKKETVVEEVPVTEINIEEEVKETKEEPKKLSRAALRNARKERILNRNK